MLADTTGRRENSKINGLRFLAFGKTLLSGSRRKPGRKILWIGEPMKLVQGESFGAPETSAVPTGA